MYYNDFLMVFLIFPAALVLLALVIIAAFTPASQTSNSDAAAIAAYKLMQEQEKTERTRIRGQNTLIMFGGIGAFALVLLFIGAMFKMQSKSSEQLVAITQIALNANAPPQQVPTIINNYINIEDKQEPIPAAILDVATLNAFIESTQYRVIDNKDTTYRITDLESGQQRLIGVKQ